MAKQPTITIDIKNLDDFKAVIKALKAAYEFIDKIWEKQDIDYAIGSDEFVEYTKTRKELGENGD